MPGRTLSISTGLDLRLGSLQRQEPETLKALVIECLLADDLPIDERQPASA
jgi:hypothetical protein